MNSLSRLDLSQFKTDQVLDMSGMFTGCKNLDSLDLGMFETKKVENMASMFEGCENLKTLDISFFDTKKLFSTHLASSYGLLKARASNARPYNIFNMLVHSRVKAGASLA